MSGKPRFTAFLGASLLAGAFAANPAMATEKVHVALTDANGMGLQLDKSTVHSGMVTFDVTDESTSIEHEFLIADLNTSLDGVPYNDKKGRVEESKLQHVKELGDLKPGESGQMTLDLKPGKYLVFCNIAGHYMAGMRNVLTVTD